jgi:hypothetical protein
MSAEGGPDALGRRGADALIDPQSLARHGSGFVAATVGQLAGNGRGRP